MRSFRVALVALLAAGCGSSSPPVERASGGEEAIVLTRVRADLVCTEEVPSGEAVCVARGCQWQAPLFCSGVQPPDGVIERFSSDATRRCACICDEDLLECMARP